MRVRAHPEMKHAKLVPRQELGCLTSMDIKGAIAAIM